MAAGMVLSVAQTLFAALQCKEVRELCSMLKGYNSKLESKLEELQRTVNTIKAVLLDAEFKHQELNNKGLVWFEELRDAVYDADDFFDELTTKAQLKKLSGKKASKRVRRFFSRENQLVSAFNTSHKIKLLREKLDSIADIRIKFGFSGECIPFKRREETCSYVYESNIIGREAEKEEIVKMLLSDYTSSVSFVSIVGIGGLGKTALAQLVFNDNRIRDAFSEENMYWVCVSEEFGLKQILSKLCYNRSDCTLEDLQKEVRRKIEGKRYLLVLDDVWEEVPHKWFDLTGFLCSGGAGSRVLVTARSKEVAQAVDKDLVFELKGLSKENSWTLFKMIAFGNGDDHDARTVEIGKDIVKKCANVPLSIKVISSLLHGRDESKWEDFRDMDLANMRPYGDGQKDDRIMSTLMFSYYNLTPELKSCFSFCSLFPKDYKIEKQMLISLWLAQGYLDPILKGKSMEDVGEDYFWILLQRCFFQDVERDEHGEIEYCKIHDLMHDLAMKVSGKESLMLTDSSIGDLRQKLRHLSVTDYNADINNALSSKDCPSRETLRMILSLNKGISMFEGTLGLNFRHLRVLHLKWLCNMNPLGDELGKLLHLRYLDISHCSLEKLPRSITKLHNLQILNLSICGNLKELPLDIGKLVNLRVLDITGCHLVKELPESIVDLINLRTLNADNAFGRAHMMIHMPAGMNKLRNLQTLPYFVVGGDSSGELTDLKSLINLKGNLCINVGRFLPSNMPTATKGADILTKARLKDLEIICEYDMFLLPLDQGEYQETLLEGLNPNNDHLRKLVMRGYQGIEFPKWGLGKLSFPAGIVRMVLTDCVGLKHLSMLSKLVNLQYLHLSEMKKLEYIERDTPSYAPSETFFQSLEELSISGAVELKEWWRDITWKEKDGEGCLEDANGSCVEVLPSFPRLRLLTIKECESLRYFPPCPHLKKLNLRSVNKALTFCMKKSTYFHQSLVKDTNLSTSSSSSDSLSNDPSVFCLKRVDMDDYEVFNSLFRESFLSSFHINMSKLNFWWEAIEEDLLNFLSIRGCNLLSVSKGIKYLTNLQSLKIEQCNNLEFLGEGDEERMPWKSLSSLSSLELCDLQELVKLPKWLQYLTSLQSVKIERCYDLEDLGEIVGYLTSLQSLHIGWCPKLKSLPKQLQYLTSLQSLKIINCDDLEELGENFGSLTSLQSLHIDSCYKLKSLPKWLQYLTSLQSLKIERCENLEELGEIVGSLTSLQSLYIEWCPKLKSLPKGLQYLTSLQSLKIEECEKLEEIGENFGYLTSLQSLHIEKCPKLKSLPEAVHHIPRFKLLNN